MISPSEAFALALDRPPEPPSPIRPSLLGRIVVGTVIAAGFAVGLREWAIALAMQTEDWATNWWTTPTGIATAFFLRLLAVCIGGASAGVGRPSGLASGAVVGTLAGIAFLFADSALGIRVTPIAVGLGFLLVVTAALAGSFGARFWPGPAEIPKSTRESSRGSSLLQLVEDSASNGIVRPTNWIRVILAGTLGMAAIATADPIRQGIQKIFGAALDLGSPATLAYVDLQIALILLILAGVVAGANTGIGTRQGILAGVLLTVAVLMTSVRSPNLPPAIEGWLRMWELPVSLRAGDSLVAVVGGLLGIMVFGSILGNALLPPLAVGAQRSRSLSPMM
ncbi:MAG: hypothetical protein LC104_05435 [Bacteroidales bacterium]|nr:hypothetical protein [Bacteroidales bacterium]